MRIAVIDFQWSGHHSSWFKLFCEALLEAEHTVFAFCPEPDEVRDYIFASRPAFENHFYAFEVNDTASLSVRLSRIGGLLTRLQRWREAARCLEQNLDTSADLVFFPYLDGLLHPLLFPVIVDRLFKVPWCGVYFHPRHLRSPNRIRRWLIGDVALRSQYCTGVAVLDKGIAMRINANHCVIMPEFAMLTKPDEDNEAVRKIYKQAQNRPIIGMFGTISKRKGLIALIQVIQASPSELFFLIVGKLVETDLSLQERQTIAHFLDSLPENCYVYLDWIHSDAQFDGMLKTCTLLTAVYADFYHSSNMLVKASQFGIPIVVSNRYYMCEQVTEYDLGLCVDENDPVALLDAINVLLQKDNRFLRHGQLRYLSHNSIEAMKFSLRNLINVSAFYE